MYQKTINKIGNIIFYILLFSIIIIGMMFMYGCSYNISNNCKVTLDSNGSGAKACIQCDSIAQILFNKKINSFLKRY